jgi:Flp pilus assembly protein TadB
MTGHGDEKAGWWTAAALRRRPGLHFLWAGLGVATSVILFKVIKAPTVPVLAIILVILIMRITYSLIRERRRRFTQDPNPGSDDREP